METFGFESLCGHHKQDQEFVTLFHGVVLE